MTNKIDRLTRAAEARDQRRYADASKTYLEVLDAFGPDPDVMWGLALSEFALSIVSPDADDTHGNNAIRWIERAIALKPDRADYHFLLGAMLEQVGAPNHEAAAHAYRRALELEPYYAPALAALANLFDVPENVVDGPEKIVSLDEAISSCEKALRVDPTRSRWMVLERLYGYAAREEDRERALKNSLLEMYDLTPFKY